jgi:hypothetical protein
MFKEEWNNCLINYIVFIAVQKDLNLQTIIMIVIRNRNQVKKNQNPFAIQSQAVGITIILQLVIDMQIKEKHLSQCHLNFNQQEIKLL